MTLDPTPPPPLAGIRVIEIASYISGPLAGSLLAGLGADVIKIEEPVRGDPFRSWGGGDYSPTFRSVNRGKRSIGIDLGDPAGAAIAIRLLERADVLIENLRPGALRRLGIDVAAIQAVNPTLTACSISGFGDSGPYAQRPGYDTIGQAVGGLLGLLTDLDDPRPMGVSISDQLTGINAALGILASLAGRARDPSAPGRRVTTSLLQSTVAFVGENAARYFENGQVPDRHSRVALAQAYAFTAGDGLAFVVHLSSPDKFWLGLTAAIDRIDLRTDPRFGELAQRIDHYDELREVLQSVFATRQRERWLEALGAADVPAGPIQRLDELFADPGVDELGMVEHVWHPIAGDMRLIGAGVSVSAAEPARQLPPPLLGEHGDEVLGELGWDAADVRRLRSEGVIR